MNTNYINDNNILEWAKELDLAITVSDINNKIIYMNNKSEATFNNTKIGDKLEICHTSHSNDVIEKMKNENISNTYTIQKKGIKKIIHQTPWYKNGVIAGLVEFSIILPNNMPHYNRDEK